METSTVGDHIRTLNASITEQGKYFSKHKSYIRENFWQKVENMPKRFWFVGLFVVTQAYNVNDLVKDVSKCLSPQSKKESLQQSPKQDTSQNK